MIKVNKADKEYTEYKLALKPSILKEADKQFSIHGIKAVKMDDIAKALGISKRTLYELYATKEVLLEEVVMAGQEERRAAFEAMKANFNDCIDVLVSFMTFQIQTALKVNTCFFEDLKRYPEVSAKIRAYHEKQYDRAVEFFNQGVKEGYFISFVDYALFQNILSSTMDMLFKDDRYSNLTFQELFLGYICVVLRGFCTEKGLRRIDGFIKDTQRTMSAKN